MQKMRAVASRVVSWKLQEEFAGLSGDRNPMHMDELAARRTQAGQPVVHGIHTLLWALNTLVAEGVIVSTVTRIKAKFLKWVYIGDEATLKVAAEVDVDPRSVQVEVIGMPVLSFDLTYGEWVASGEVSALMASPAKAAAIAVERSFAELEACSGNAFTASDGEAGAMFPELARYLTPRAVAEIAACSYVVGMEAPGLHSMFSKLDLTLHPTTEVEDFHAGLQYRVSYHDERFRKARISVDGRAISGTLEVFVRLPPVEQATMQEVAKEVSPGEFAGVRALVVGGSRGLGELTAKLIAAGGGKTTITYARGKTEAEMVAKEISEWGGEVDVIAYDVRASPEMQLAGLRAPVTHLFYFATNPIFRPKGDLLSPPIFADFVAFYLQGFHDLCLQLLKNEQPYALDGAKLIAYYPSSIAVEERPAGMTEYAMVKAAGEQMCRDMNQYLTIQILTTRLPRLRTDQTTGVIPEREVDPSTVMLPIVREMISMGRKT